MRILDQLAAAAAVDEGRYGADFIQRDFREGSDQPIALQPEGGGRHGPFFLGHGYGESRERRNIEAANDQLLGTLAIRKALIW